MPSHKRFSEGLGFNPAVEQHKKWRALAPEAAAFDCANLFVRSLRVFEKGTANQLVGLTAICKPHASPAEIAAGKSNQTPALSQETCPAQSSASPRSSAPRPPATNLPLQSFPA